MKVKTVKNVTRQLMNSMVEWGLVCNVYLHTAETQSDIICVLENGQIGVSMKNVCTSTIEETSELRLDFHKISSMIGQEVIPVAVQNFDTNEVILVAYTNEQAMLESIKLRRLVLWSTSRNEIWHKGKTSGNEFELKEILVNCEQNSLVYKVHPLNGNICHTSYNGKANNCFYRKLDFDKMNLINLNEQLEPAKN